MQNIFGKNLGKVCFIALAAIFVMSGFFVAGSVSADTVILSPNGIGNYDQWSLTAGTDKVTAVTSDNDNTSYITETTSGQSQTYTIPGAGIPAGAVINSVTLNVKAKKTQGTSSINLRIQNDTGPGGQSDDSAHNLTTVWTLYNRVMTVNPFTSVAWTVSEVNSWITKFGVKYNDIGTNNNGGVTYIYVVVDYTPASSTGSLTVTKNTIGADGTFTFIRTGDDGTFEITTLQGTGSTIINDLAPGTYSVTETVPDGWDKTGDTCQSVTVNAGQSTSCTIENTKLSTITGMKFDDLNGNSLLDAGEPRIAGLKMALGRMQDGPPQQQIPIEIVALSLTGANGDFSFSVPVGNYKLFEEDKNGWMITTPARTPGIDSSFSITWAQGITPIPLITDSFFDVFIPFAGFDVSSGFPSACGQQEGPCSSVPIIFGNFKLITVTIQKEVMAPDGQTPVEDNTLFTAQLNQLAPASFSEQIWPIYPDLGPGSHTVVEIVPGDPDFDLLRITDGNVIVTDANSITFQAVSGQDVTVVITNGQHQGHLTVTKIVDNGHQIATSVATEFTVQLMQDGSPVGSPIGFTSQENTPSVGTSESIALDPGTYSVVETETHGYSPDYSACPEFTLTSGGTATCTITNKDLETGKGAITVYKSLIKDNHGNAQPNDFTFNINGSENQQVEAPLVQVSMTSLSNGSSTQLNPGTYTVTENMPGSLAEKYTYISTVCSDNGQPAVSGDTVALEAGHVYVCTITNDDKPAQLIIVKHTGNENHNGTFNFTISGTELTPSIVTANGQGETAIIELNKGSYNLEEIVTDGWNFSNASCDYGYESEGNSLQHGVHIYVNNGSTTRCTFNNTRQTGNLTVIKLVEGGQEGVSASSFMMHIMQDGVDVVETGPGQGGEGATYSNLPTGQYTITETGGPEGFTPSFSENCPGGVVTVSDDQNTTCTVTNVAGGTLIVKKIVINDNNGTLTADDFSFRVNEGSLTAFLQGENPLQGENHISVTPGTYAVVESATTGYTATSEGCTEITIAAGETKTCTITNNDITPAPTPTPTPVISGGGGGGVAFLERGINIINGGTYANGIRIGDINQDGKVDIFDQNIMMANWGVPINTFADLNGDGVVDIADFNLLMINWTV